MKNFLNFLAAMVLLAATSCSNESELTISNQNEDQQDSLTPVTVRVGDFSMSMEDFSDETTRAVESPEAYTNVKALTLAFYNSDGTQAYCSTQLKADNTTYTTFGSFSLTLPGGSYKMIVLGYNSEYPVAFNSMSDVSFGEDKSRELFCYTQDVVVSVKTPVDLTATLNRIVTKLNVSSSDNLTADVKKIRISLSKGGKSFNPFTGFATSDAGLVSDVTVTADVGKTTLCSVNFFIAGDEETMNVTIETLDANDNVIFSKVAENVPFKRNRVTILKGAMYDGRATGAFTLETNWSTSYEGTF